MKNAHKKVLLGIGLSSSAALLFAVFGNWAGTEDDRLPSIMSSGQVTAAAASASAPSSSLARLNQSSSDEHKYGAGLREKPTATVTNNSSTEFLGVSVGSEGYGPHIAAAAARGNPEESMVAYQKISFCGRLDNIERIFWEVRAESNPAENKYQSSEVQNQKAETLQAERNRCQTVDANVVALAPILARRAVEGHVVGGAEAYADTVLTAGKVESWPQALQYLREAANRMDTTAFAMLAHGDRTVQLDDVERMAYQIVVDRLEREGWTYFGGRSERVGSMGQAAYELHLSETQAKEAMEKSKLIYDGCCKGWKKK